LIDLEKKAVFQPIEYDSEDIEWFGDEGGRGLRGMALDSETVYIAASNRLLAYNKRFKLVNSWQNPCLADCRGICIYQRKLFLVSAGNDCILSFDLDEKKFHWALQVQSEHFQFAPLPFDPLGAEGPLFINKLHLRTVHCGEGGIYISGLKTNGILHFNGKEIYMLAELPGGAQDAQLFRNGVLFNDSPAGVLRYAGGDDGAEDRALAIPFFTESDHAGNDPDETRRLKRGYGRGLCILSDTVVAGGSTPAGVSLYHLKENKCLMTVRFTKIAREAVNCIAVLQQ
jgi:hypothetical protein